MCNSISLVLWTVFCGTGGTGGTAQDLVRAGGTGGWDRWDRHCQGSCCSHGSAIFHGGPTGPTYQSHQTLQNGLEYHQYHRSHPCTRLSYLGDEKRLYRVTQRVRHEIALLGFYLRATPGDWS